MLYPLFKVGRDKVAGTTLVIASSHNEAIERAKLVWDKKNLIPLYPSEHITVHSEGTVDYIPTLQEIHIGANS